MIKQAVAALQINYAGGGTLHAAGTHIDCSSAAHSRLTYMTTRQADMCLRLHSPCCTEHRCACALTACAVAGASRRPSTATNLTQRRARSGSSASSAGESPAAGSAGLCSAEWESERCTQVTDSASQYLVVVTDIGAAV
jgi:hypothetical protein